MEETSGPRERESADWVGKLDGEYVSRGPGDNMGAGRKEKYRAWKLGGARAYTMAVKSCKSENEGWLYEEGEGSRDGQGGVETTNPSGKCVLRTYLCGHRPVRLLVRRLPRSKEPKRRRESGLWSDGRETRGQIAKRRSS